MGPGPVVNLWQAIIRVLNSEMVIRFCGLHSKMRRRMKSSSEESGKMVLNIRGSFRYARNVLSEGEARFQGFRPHVRFTRITPSDQTSLGADA